VSVDTDIANLKDTEIIDYIFKYVDRVYYDYAVLIDGDWGCGKTYFIKKKLIPALEENEKTKCSKTKGYKEKRVIYISLYGIKSIEDLTRQITIEFLPLKSILKSKEARAVSSIGKIVIGGFLSIKGLNLNPKDFSIDNFFSIDNCILIFDDLERCNLNLIDLLGFINIFVEQDGLKTIIISNEKEIACANRNLNKELKLLAATNCNISFPNKEQVGEEKKESNLNLEELKHRVSTLFDEDEIFKKTKEKVIGKTIKYKPNLNEVLDAIVSDTICRNDLKIKEIVLNNKKFIIEKAKLYEHPNIRTILFCLDIFSTIAEYLIAECEIKGDDTEFFNDTLGEMFKYLVIVSIRYKNDLKLLDWAENVDIEVSDLGGNEPSLLDRYYKSYKFIDDFVLGAKFDQEKAKKIVCEDVAVKKSCRLKEDDDLEKLSNSWYNMDDVTAVRLLDEVNHNINNHSGKYKTVQYPKILELNIKFNELGLTNNSLNDLIKCMKEDITSSDFEKNGNVFEAFGWSSSAFDSQEEIDLFNSYIIELKGHFTKCLEERDRTISSVLFDDQEKWTDQIDKYSAQSLNRRSFMSSLDVCKLESAIKKSTIEQIRCFRSVIHDVYGFQNIKDYYKNDSKAIGILIERIKEYYTDLIKSQKIKACNINYLVKDLEDILKRLEESDDSTKNI